jgi:lipid II:glycine glycyltransferase (peptidoglycan interpeptide bridge formation enzyme)
MISRPKTVLTGRIGEDDAAAFEAFVRASPFAAWQQSLAWAESAPRGGRRGYLHFLCRDGEALIGTAVVRATRLAPGAALATVQRGPVVSDAARLETVCTALQDALRASGFATLVAAPRIAGEDRAEAGAALRRCGFSPLRAQEQALHTATGRILLAGGETEILAGFKQRGRRSIRQSQAAGLTVRDASQADLGAAQALVDAFHARKAGYDASGQPSVAVQARLIAREGGALLVAEEEGRIVGWHSFVRQGRDAIWLALATDNDPKAARSYLLIWEAVRRARALGLAGYDLAGLAADGEATGREQFKQAFAPVREELLPAHVCALRPLRHAVFFTARQTWRRLRQR